ncbi:2OG-Fe(II) oxygenase [bacterium]|nr:2OG-Fe(II) oxygenase [bacterium]
MTPFHLIPEALSPAECAALIAVCEAGPMKDAGLVRAVTAHQIRRADLSWLDDLPEAAWVLDRMIGVVARANREAFGFDLTECGESPQVARYDAARQGHFDWHSDIGAGALAARRKLTVVVQLSDPQDYVDGSLELRPDSSIRTAPRDRGMAIVFPSFVLHRVTPVTQGTRWSLTLWSHGPAFR